MAIVTSGERRFLLDAGYTSEQIDNMLQYRADALLASFQERELSGFSEFGEYEGPTPAEVLDDSQWIERGLGQTASDISTGLQSTGEAIITTSRQVGTGLAQAVGVTSAMLKFLIPAGIILAGYIVWVRYGR